jgi:hypothetical protein
VDGHTVGGPHVDVSIGVYQIFCAKVLVSSQLNPVSRISNIDKRATVRLFQDLLARAVDEVYRAACHQDRESLLIAYKTALAEIDHCLAYFEKKVSCGFSGSYGPPASMLIEKLRAEQFDIHGVNDIIAAFQADYQRETAIYLRVAAARQILYESAIDFKLDLSKANAPKVIRSITFPPAYKQAGISILAYFGHIVNVKYPNIDVQVTIEQIGEKINLVIDTPQGTKELIERELCDYGLVVSGELAPDKYMEQPYEVMALKHKLEIAHLEARQCRDMLQSERSLQGARIAQLEEWVQDLRNMLGKNSIANSQLLSALTELASRSTGSVNDALRGLIAIVEKGLTQNDEERVLEEYRTIQKDDPPILAQLRELLLKGAVQGAAGNYLFNWLNAMASFFC